MREWFSLTFLMGAFFISGQIYEYAFLVSEGLALSTNAYSSVFYIATGFHGLHVTGGLIWMAVMMYQIQKKGITGSAKTRMGCLSLFWHFLDVVWICVFTVVYLLGVL